MLLRWFAAWSAGLVVLFLVCPTEWRGLPFMLLTLSAVPAVWSGARRSPAGTRSPWWLLLAMLGFFNVGNMVWLWDVEVRHHATGDGGLADLFFTVANVCSLAGALTVVVRRGRRDVGGVIDSAVAALAFGGLLWDAAVLPHLTATGTSLGRQVALFFSVFVMCGTMGALARVSMASGPRLPAVRLLAWAMAGAMSGNLAAIFFTDPATGVRPDWTNALFMMGYACVACAALHPSAITSTQPGPAPADDLTPLRLTFLGTMVALIPIVGGIRMMAGQPSAGILVAFGSAGIVPLVMLRISRLAAQRRLAEQRLQRLVTTDALTGLPNRVACMADLTTALAGSPAGTTVIFCDLDGFKAVNDRLGHAAGDALLVAVAERLRDGVPGGYTVYRLGGDEFVFICPGDAVDTITARIRDLVTQSIPVGAGNVRIGVSAGVAHAVPGDTTDELIVRADLAMYDAKRSKRIGALSLSVAAEPVAA
ncbi:GGDEF domain-containing protein [Actinoplanes sp. NPDC023801]|uniref:GGDEF domain-containing protein n=1 Tax=Actinoplanes sp. NPDC023801 TaxID=3154595 RepID=UPI0034025964